MFVEKKIVLEINKKGRKTNGENSLLSNKPCFFQRRYVGGDKKHHGENIFVVMYIENQGWME
jgi:hypothetical protein